MAEDVNKLYTWINKRYNLYLNGELAEEDYTQDLDIYKAKLAESQENIEKYVQKEETSKTRTPKDKINPNKVRSTSIAGLRKKLLDEMKK
jgi:DNA mismatch repair ATPase MutS